MRSKKNSYQQSVWPLLLTGWILLVVSTGFACGSVYNSYCTHHPFTTPPPSSQPFHLHLQNTSFTLVVSAAGGGHPPALCGLPVAHQLLRSRLVACCRRKRCLHLHTVSPDGPTRTAPALHHQDLRPPPLCCHLPRPTPPRPAPCMASGTSQALTPPLLTGHRCGSGPS